MFRNIDEKQEILNRLEPTLVHENAITEDLLNKLISAYETGEKNHKPTGPVTVDYYPNEKDEWWTELNSLLTTYIGEHLIFATNFFDVTKPHIIHNDDSLAKKPRLYKTVVIPLRIKKPTNFVVFDQCYLDGPIKGRHGAKQELDATKAKYYNQNLFDNSQLEYYTNNMFDEVIWNKYLTHQPIERFWGLSVEKIVPWKPGNIIIFDTARLHCATDFVTQGIDRKLGYSVFTHLEK